ncbi:MAG TPA: peptide chain release factor N(5)-glutamine methyltransferase [Planctomycetota bacterium]|nr:peptide chain release factor N(5)-glutamine methyltransferase [Planctomycetota bacterium]
MTGGEQGARPPAPQDPERTWTVLELIRWTTQHFGERGLESPRLDAEVLLAHALGVRRLDLYLQFDKPVLPAERARYRELVSRRVRERVPVSLLIGEREFWSLSFRVSPDVLTPRPETEILVEAALRRLPGRGQGQRVLDVGTGSGAIALAIAHERPEASITATDLCAKALQIARINADQLHIGEGVRFLEGSLFEPVRGERFELIVSNPPYLARADAEALPPELAHEPEAALFGGEDGYEVLRPFAAGVKEMLEPGGFTAVEVDPGQVEAVSRWFSEAGLIEIESLRDFAGRPRVVAARRAPAQ